MVLRDKVAVITAAGGGGCGRAIAIRLAREGCRVVASDLDSAAADETVRQIETAGGTLSRRVATSLTKRIYMDSSRPREPNLAGSTLSSTTPVRISGAVRWITGSKR